MWAAQLTRLDLLLRDGARRLDGVGAPLAELDHGVSREEVELAEAVHAVVQRRVPLVPPHSARLHDEHEALELDSVVRVEDVLKRRNYSSPAQSLLGRQ